MEADERPAKSRKLCSEDEDLPANGNLDLQDRAAHSSSLTEEALPATTSTYDFNIVEVQDSDQPVQPGEQQQENLTPNDDKVISKSQLKKIRKKQEWEAGREHRKLVRKQKLREKKARQRDAIKHQAQNAGALSKANFAAGPEDIEQSNRRPGVPRAIHGIQLPVTFIVDCGFDQLMHERERISLASQITRAYSDNHRAPFKGHLVLSSWGGELKTRFDTVLNQHYKNWKGVQILEDDFVEAVNWARGRMRSPQGGKLAGSFTDETRNDAADEGQQIHEVIYLTSDSDNTLDRLKPYSAYIIGGLVDKNRHKGICYKSACDKGIKTAKLPIGEYMDMQSRYVLATNHVIEIMIRWLECGDWGNAFLRVMPKRKGGKLKTRPQALDTGDRKEVEEIQKNKPLTSEETRAGDANGIAQPNLSCGEGIEGAELCEDGASGVTKAEHGQGTKNG